MVDDDTRRPWEPTRLNPELAAALVAALGELDDVAKTRTAAAGQYSYRYATLGDVLGEARPVLARHGLAVSQYVDVEAVGERGVNVAVHTRVVHVSGHVLEVPPLAISAAATAQAIGSAATYGRRYQAMAVLGVAGDDDDGAEATRTAPAPPALSPRTEAERAIRRMLDSVPVDIARRVRDAFRQHFDSTLTALPAERHDDALEYVSTLLEAELAHDDAEQPDPVTPKRENAS